MTGTEKQVAWAQDIKARYENLLPALREIADTLADCSMIETPVTHRRDPLGRAPAGAMSKRYAADLTNAQHAVIATASAFAPMAEARFKGESKHDRRIRWGIAREAEIGGQHAFRLALRDSVTETIRAIEAALETEDDAVYWIDIHTKG
jgi:hypothetical protein